MYTVVFFGNINAINYLAAGVTLNPEVKETQQVVIRDAALSLDKNSNLYCINGKVGIYEMGGGSYGRSPIPTFKCFKTIEFLCHPSHFIAQEYEND